MELEMKDKREELDLSNLSSGVYFIRIGSFTKKLIKE
jgi:hypothetical protein